MENNRENKGENNAGNNTERRRKKLLFDIANFSGQGTMAGVPRYIVEVLTRLVKRQEFDITLLCSLPEEEFAYRNLRRFIDFDLPFVSYEGKDYSKHYRNAKAGSDNQTQLTFLKGIELKVKHFFPKSKFVQLFIDAVRAIKWKVFGTPKFLTIRQRSSVFEELVRNSDIYFSPFHRLIPELDVNPSIKKVLVVHDLVPVLFADLYKGWSHFRLNPWENITPDVIVLADSESTKRDLIKCYPQVSEQQVSVVYLAVDSRFKMCGDTDITNTEAINAVLRKYKVPPECPYIFSIATLDVRKNFDVIIRGYTRLVSDSANRGLNTPDVRLVLSGVKGWQNEVFYELYGQLPVEIKNRIIFTGYIADADLPLLYTGASCFCYMSLYEGFGLPLLEAMKSGTPVITANNSSLTEVAGDAAILLDAKDEVGLSDAFCRILSDETLRQELIQKGFRQAEKFSWEKCVNEIIAAISGSNIQSGREDK
jgi:glycosyltransferase involved in cell wall biosynthesis